MINRLKVIGWALLGVILIPVLGISGLFVIPYYIITGRWAHDSLIGFIDRCFERSINLAQDNE